jgi:hypothetical protein
MAQKDNKKKKKTDQARIDALVQNIRQNYPEYAIFFDNDFGGFSQEVRDLLIEYATDPEYTADLFDSKFKQTQYYLQVDKDIQNWNKATPEVKRSLTEAQVDAIRANYGNLFKDESELERVAEGAARQNLKGTRLRSFVYSQLSETNKAQTAATSTLDADAIRAIGNQYGYRVADSEIESILTGKPEVGTQVVLTEQDLRNRAKLAAIGEMPHLKEQLDSGLTIQQIFRNYQQEAAETLGVDPNQINFTNPKWRAALSKREENGTVRQLSLAEWRRELRTNPEYEYQFTPQANRDATDIALTLARAFGKVM